MFRTDIEDAHTLFQTDLAADQIELGFLGGVERFGFTPIAAGIDHARVEHAPVEVITDVVVLFADLAHVQPLWIEDHALDGQKRQSRIEFDPILQLPGQAPVQELVDCLAVPPAIHIGLTQPQCPLGHHATEQPVVMNLDVPRS